MGVQNKLCIFASKLLLCSESKSLFPGTSQTALQDSIFCFAKQIGLRHDLVRFAKILKIKDLQGLKTDRF